jgi:hypothetical protein
VQSLNRVVKSPDVLSQEVDGETVLLDLDGESYFGLDKTGTRIWQLLDEHETVSAVYEQLLSEFDVDEDTLRKDLHEHLEALKQAGLIKSLDSRD